MRLHAFWLRFIGKVGTNIRADFAAPYGQLHVSEIRSLPTDLFALYTHFGDVFNTDSSAHISFTGPLLTACQYER